MIKPRDREFDDLVQRLDVDVSAQDLAEADEILAGAADEPAPRAWVDATVARVTTPGPVTWTRRIRHLPLAAAVLFGALLLGAAVTFRLVWPEARDSGKTLDYPRAIALLADPNQPEEMRATALADTFRRIQFGIEQLQETRIAPATPRSVASGAEGALRELHQMLVAADVPAPGRVDESLLDETARLRDASRTEEQRLRHLTKVTDLLRNGALALRRMEGLSADRERERQLLIRRLIRAIEKGL